MPLNSAQKKQYRAIGHHLKPIVTVAGNGLSEAVIDEVERALHDHELIKIKLAVGDKTARQAACDLLCKQLTAELVQLIGNNALLLRKSNKPNPKLSNLLRVES